MKIVYVSLSYVPSRRASSVHVMKMCAALARAGHDVTVTTKASPSREEPGVDNPFAYYGVEASFDLEKLPRPAWRGGGLLHLWQSRRFLRRLDPTPDIVYSRDLATAALSSISPVLMVFEAHSPPTPGLSNALYRRLFSLSNLRRLVVISEALAELFQQSRLLPPELDLVVAHDAADPLRHRPRGEAAIPASLSAPGMLHVGYVGHLYRGRGIELIAALAERLSNHRFHIVGGSRADLERWRARSTPGNLYFHGFVAPSQLPGFYEAFDVVLAPYQQQVLVASGRTDTSSWMSPMKLFEYMASGKPIVCSDLPVLREVLRHGENALLVSPHDTAGWLEAIETLAAMPELAHRLGEGAFSGFTRHHTWDVRAARVLAGL